MWNEGTSAHTIRVFVEYFANLPPKKLDDYISLAGLNTGEFEKSLSELQANNKQAGTWIQENKNNIAKIGNAVMNTLQITDGT